jgi:hypothetical protein
MNLIMPQKARKEVFLDKTISWAEWSQVQSQLLFSLFPVIASALITLICRFALPNSGRNITYDGLALWIWTVLPCLVISTCFAS